MMKSVIPYKHKGNYEFKNYVDQRVMCLNAKGFIVDSVVYRKDEFNRCIGAIITYKERSH